MNSLVSCGYSFHAVTVYTLETLLFKARDSKQTNKQSHLIDCVGIYFFNFYKIKKIIQFFFFLETWIW